VTSAHEPAYTREHGPMEVPVRVIQFQDQIRGLRKEPAWEQGNRAARTLVKEGGLRAVLTLMRAGAALHEHRTEGPVTIQCLAGHMALHAHGQDVELVPGEMAALDSGVEHSVKAITESALLITIGT
jgi:quercetin dioxygenase-like cupin family protein